MPSRTRPTTVRVYHCIHCKNPGGTLQRYGDVYAHKVCHEAYGRMTGVQKGNPSPKLQMVTPPGKLIVPDSGLKLMRRKVPKL